MADCCNFTVDSASLSRRKVTGVRISLTFRTFEEGPSVVTLCVC